MDRPPFLPAPTIEGSFDAEHERTDLRRYLLWIEKVEGRRTVTSVDFGDKLAQGIEGYIIFGSIMRAVSYKRQTVRTDFCLNPAPNTLSFTPLARAFPPWIRSKT